MVKQIEREIARDVAYYYDAHPTEEDLVSESSLHKRLVTYLALVLEWHLREQLCSIYENMGFYQTRKSGEKPLAPDIAVVKGMTFQAVRSWKIGKTGPAPRVVFEIISEETGDKDLGEKPTKYARMGVEEYFAYDPNEQPIRKGTTRRLYGWQRNKVTGQMDPMPVGPDGRVWSQELESFLVPEGEYLRLYDRTGQLCLTEAQAQEQAKWAETRRADTEAEAKQAERKRADAAMRRADAEAEAKRAEARRAEAEKRRADEEARRAEVEKRRADAEAEAKRAEARRAEAEKRRADEGARRAEVEKRRADALAEKLRSLGIDPNQI